jgi:L-alanine-DL-glutamate epimerase-like enolase superfamily enzyme
VTGLPAARPALAMGEICASVIELEAMAATGEVAFVRADAALLGGAAPWPTAVGHAEAAGLAVPDDGRIAAPATPGFGYALDWEAIAAAAGPPQVARIDEEGG